ncbi:MAG: UDP-2,4-diacetamido-2,4,6-trideoxy-beta-L-altropyranose hydrolase [bacterium]|nr:MAG: UDP-2,4-diacetamido-2,4,6-trideoxy-beta-L-altropyranose hydrolase [bacterium]
MRVVSIVQARMGSTRLPGKVMFDLAGRSVLSHVIERVRSCPLVDDIVVATTINPEDDVIAEEACRNGVASYRGSEENVLERYYEAAVKAGAEVIVRVTSDCPLLDPQVLTGMLNSFTGRKSDGESIDYLSNTLERTFPRGLDVEIFTYSALEKAHMEAKETFEREHVTPYMYNHPDIFRLRNYRSDTDLSEHRWTLDVEDDFTLIKEIYGSLFEEGEVFTTDDVVRLLRKRPELIQINTHVLQKKINYHVAFRVDASNLIGSGHVMRCLTLAHVLLLEGHHVTFISRKHPGHLSEIVHKAEIPVIQLEYRESESGRFQDNGYEEWLGTDWKTDALDTSQAIEEINSTGSPVDWLIIDHYGIDRRWEQMMRSLVDRIMVIDDLANRPHDCDLLLDQNLRYDHENIYRDLVPSHCRMLLGPRHALLRPEFKEARAKLKKRDGIIETVLIFFGGTDSSNETGKALEAVIELGADLRVDIVLGYSNPHAEDLQKRYGQRPGLRFHRHVSNMAQMMARSDLSIGACGTTTWERCYLGLPSIILVVAENQLEIARALDEAGAVINLGRCEKVDVELITRTLKSVLNNPDRLMEISVKSMALTGSNGSSVGSEVLLALRGE